MVKENGSNANHTALTHVDVSAMKETLVLKYQADTLRSLEVTMPREKQLDAPREFAIAALVGLVIRTHAETSDDYRDDEDKEKSRTEDAERLRNLHRVWAFTPHEERRAAAVAIQHLMGHHIDFERAPDAVRSIARAYRISEEDTSSLALEVLRGAVMIGPDEADDWEVERGRAALHLLREYRPLSRGATVPFLRDIEYAFALPADALTSNILEALVRDFRIDKELPEGLRALLVAVDVIDPLEDAPDP